MTAAVAPPKLRTTRVTKFPSVHRLKLPCGVSLSIIKDRRFPKVALAALVPAGESYTKRGGLAKIVARCLKEGTTHHHGPRIIDIIEMAGGDIGGDAGTDRAMVQLDLLSSEMEKGLGIVAEMLLQPVFPHDEIRAECARLAEETRIRRSNAEFVANEIALATLFGDHPYGRGAPRAASLRESGRRDALSFHLAHYGTNTVEIVAVGDVDPKRLASMAEAAFSLAEAAVPAIVARRRPSRQAPSSVRVVDRKGSVQSAIVLARRGPSYGDRRHIRAILLLEILGGGINSRLFLRLRQRHGFTYSISSRLECRELAASITIRTSVRSGVTGEALQAIREELARLADELVPEKELASAKRSMAGRLAISLESPSSLLGRLLQIVRYDLPADYFGTITDRIQAVTARDLRRLARSLLDPAGFGISIAGPAENIVSQLGKRSDVEVVATPSD